jgi:hypothetical protein
MTYEPDIERVLDRWFGEGPARMPDGFLDRMVGRIDGAPQARLPRLRRRAFTFALDLNGRLVAAALATVVIVGVAGGAALSRLPAVGIQPSPSPSVLPSPSPSAGQSAAAQAVVDLGQLQATWTSVGTRPLPYKSGSVPGPTDVVIGPGTMLIVEIGDDGRNSATLVGTDRLELTSETPPNAMYWNCKVGDLGTYDLSLSETGDSLTLTPVSDACPSRAAVLTGDWDHTNLGPLDPGRHVATPFRPFGTGTNGSLSYSVPIGWTEQGESQSNFAISRPDSAVLTWISVLSNVIPSNEYTGCGGAPAAGVGRTPVDDAAWLAALPGLVVTKPTPVRIGGLDGVMVDLSVAPTWIQPCTTPSQPGTDVSTFAEGPYGDAGLPIGGETRARYILLDRGDGQTLLIDIEAQDSSTWPAVLDAAMPVVNTFEFTR